MIIRAAEQQSQPSYLCTFVDVLNVDNITLNFGWCQS